MVVVVVAVVVGFVVNLEVCDTFYFLVHNFVTTFISFRFLKAAKFQSGLVFNSSVRF